MSGLLPRRAGSSAAPVSTAGGLRAWLAVLVVLLLLLAGAGSGALLLGDGHRDEAVRLDALAAASTDLALAASGSSPGGPATRLQDVEDAGAAALALASGARERRAVERELGAARAWADAVALRAGAASAPESPLTQPAQPAPGQGVPGPAALLSAHHDLLEGLAAESAALREREVHLRRTSLAVVGLVLAGALALTLHLAVRVRRGLVSPLADVADVLGALTAGDHERRADADRGPAEVRAVARWVNALADEGDRSRTAQERTARLRRLAGEVGRLARDPLDPRASLEEALGVLGEGLGVDRAWVRLVSGSTEGELGALQGSWTRPGAPPVVEEVAGAPRPTGTWLQRAWDDQEPCVADDLRAVVAGGAAHAALVDLVERTGATTAVIAPVGAGDAAVGALTVLGHDGPRAWTPEEVALLRSVAADLGRAVVVAHLLQDSEALVDQLRELDVRKSTFLATVSHELRTPLTSIAGYVELLREGGAGPVGDGVDRMLSVVERNTVRLRVLIEDLLALSNIEDGAPRGVHEPVGLGDVVREVVEEHRGAAGSGGLALDLDVDLDAELLGALRVTGDAASLRRALSGLLSNAVKFTPAGGCVTISARREGEWAVVEVVDTGIGIPLGEQGGLFTRFFRASNATALAVPGAGLGLTIARSVVEHHDGRVLITSTPGEGTTARVMLPAPRPAPED